VTDLIILLLLAYLLGSVSGSLVVGRFRHVDIRTLGSGNAGGTNAFRTQGLRFALAAVMIDVSKSILASAWIPTLQIGIEIVELLYAGDTLLSTNDAESTKKPLQCY